LGGFGYLGLSAGDP